MVHNVEIGPNPHVTYMIISVLFTLVFSHAEDEHSLRILKILEIKHRDRRVYVWETV